MLTKLMLSPVMMRFDIWLVKHTAWSLLTWMHAVQSHIRSRPALLLVTKGAKSGLCREVVLPYFMQGAEYVVIGSKGGTPQDPAWVTNIRADSAVSIFVGRKKCSAVARFAAAPLRDELYAQAAKAVPSYTDYQARTARIIPVLLLRRT